jgi:hypothetical protein
MPNRDVAIGWSERQFGKPDAEERAIVNEGRQFFSSVMASVR